VAVSVKPVDDESVAYDVIDSCAFHEWSATADLAEYMDDGWRQVVMRAGDKGGPLKLASRWLYQNPAGDKLPDAYPEVGVPGSDAGLLKSQLADGSARTKIVLGYHDGLLATGFPFPYISRAAVAAANDLTIDRWLGYDERFFGLVLVATSRPEDAASEIRRVGTHPRMVAVAMGANGLTRPFGDSLYHPIYEAAAELSLPVVLQVGSDAMTDQLAPPMAGGLAGTFAEYKVLGAQPFMTHAASIITEGVLDRHPGLRFLLVGTGAAWIPGYLWRLDYWYKAISQEVPWMENPPSEYFRKHFCVSTYGLEWPRKPQQLIDLLSVLPDVEKLLLYASGYPSYDAEEPATTAKHLPVEWRRNIMYENALDFFRWPSGVVIPHD
jgi:hypothetical protein